ncbi:response regulator transcription factor [Amycolatopsis nigrescens]|uniref:response regulator transcription factor n=1 Tax=Amycolatopsis nigrescens TaxID=381445 RepID=UPI0003810F60|nr:response regulator transcription factor [Amycolatopsis nigrescens]
MGEPRAAASGKPRERPGHPVRVLLVEDHDMVAEAITLAFDAVEDIEIVARACSLEQAFRQVARHRPKVVVLDRRLPDGDGIPAISELREASPDSRVLVLTGDANQEMAGRVLESGGAGLLVKSAGLADLAAAVRRVAGGEAVFGGTLLQMLDRLTGRSGGTAGLTPREHELLVLLADGVTTTEIAGRLSLARNTVRNHVQRILAKLGAHSKLEAVAVARRQGLLD